MNYFKQIALLLVLASCTTSFTAQKNRRPSKRINPILKKLLNTGNPNAVDRDGDSALDWAITFNHTQIVKSLLNRKADANARNPKGKTPLHRALETNNMASFKLLLAAKADVTLTNARGETPRQYAESILLNGYPHDVPIKRNPHKNPSQSTIERYYPDSSQQANYFQTIRMLARAQAPAEMKREGE